MEMESPNLYNRFQQLEALQKANDMFSSLYTDIVNQSLSSELTTEEQQHLATKEKCRKVLGKLPRDMKDSQSFAASNEKVSGRDRQASFHRAHQCIPEDSVLAPLTAAQNEAAKKALAMPLNMKEGQVCTSLEMVAKGRDGESQQITFQTKKLKICTSNQPPDSFEMEEVQSFDEDSCPRMAANKIFLDMKRENSCQSDSSGFLEEPFIPLQIQRALQNVGDDSISSQATLQENGQWPSGSSDLEQATDSSTDQTCIAGSVDSDQTQCPEAHTVLCVLQKEKIFNVENFNSRPPASSNHQMIAAPCAEKNTEEINRLGGSRHCLHTTPRETTKHRSALNTSTWLSNEINVQNGAGACQNDNSVRSNAPTVSTSQENFNLVPQNSTGTSKLVTFQIPQDKLQQRNIMFHSSEPLPLLLQPNKDSPKHENVFRESRVKLRDALVQMDEITGDSATERHSQVKNCNLLAFQSGGLLKKSASLDTGLHNIENNAQEPTAIPPAHCHHCHHCSCHHHHCSSMWFNGKDGKTAVSHSERQLIKTLQQLQQTARIISASPHALQEVETMKKSLYGFRNRLLDLEQEITEQQASVYNVLTKDERDDVKRLRNLRQAVRHEVSEMEVQLEDRTQQLGEGMGMFQSLVEEQASFCSYIDDLRQTGDASSGSWPWSSSSCAIPTPAPVITSQEPDSAAGTTLPVLFVSGLSPAPSASNKTNTNLKLESDKDAEPKAKKRNQHSEMLDFRGFLLNIKQSFQQLRSPSPEPMESINH